MSDWLFDLGNSRFKFAPLHGNRAGSVQAWAHGAEAITASALEALPQGDTAWVASVASASASDTLVNSSPSGAAPKPICGSITSVRPSCRRLNGSMISLPFTTSPKGLR